MRLAEGLTSDMVRSCHGYLYRTTHRATGTAYIGQSRVKDARSLEEYLGSGDYMQAAIAEYGADAFDKEIFAVAVDQLDLDALEIQAIAKAHLDGVELLNAGIGGPRAQSPFLGHVLVNYGATPLDPQGWYDFVTNHELVREILAGLTISTADFYAELEVQLLQSQDLTRACPRCQSPAGQVCRTNNGNPTINHASRRPEFVPKPPRQPAARPLGGHGGARCCSRCHKPGHYRSTCPSGRG